MIHNKSTETDFVEAMVASSPLCAVTPNVAGKPLLPSMVGAL